jgi:hypothetical protein
MVLSITGFLDFVNRLMLSTQHNVSECRATDKSRNPFGNTEMLNLSTYETRKTVDSGCNCFIQYLYVW